MATTYPAVADKINMLHADGPCVCSAPGTYHFALGIAGAQVYPKQMFGMVKATNPGDAVALEAQVGVSIFLDEVANVPEGIVLIGPLTASGFTTSGVSTASLIVGGVTSAGAGGVGNTCSANGAGVSCASPKVLFAISAKEIVCGCCCSILLCKFNNKV